MEGEDTKNIALEEHDVADTALDPGISNGLDTVREESSGLVDFPIDAADVQRTLRDSTPLISGALVPEVIREKVDQVAKEEILEKIPDLTPEEVAIDGIAEGTTEETQPHIPESVSEGERNDVWEIVDICLASQFFGDIGCPKKRYLFTFLA